MEQPDWELRLARRHLSPPPEPADSWERLIRRRQGWFRPWGRLPAWALAGAGACAMALLVAGLWVPPRGASSGGGSASGREAAPGWEASAAPAAAPLGAWVERQWSQAGAGSSEDSSAGGGAGGMLALMGED